MGDNLPALELGSSRTSKMGFCGRCVNAIWTTSYDDGGKDQELFMKRTLRELLIYSVFLIIICIVAFGMTTHNTYYYNKVMMDLFVEKEDDNGVSFRTINNVADFWSYMNGPFLDGLYWEDWYNSQPLPPDVKGYIYYSSIMLGVPRIRQLRVRANSCEVNDEFSSFVGDCYDSYSEEEEASDTFGKKDTSGNETAWKWQTEESLKGFTFWGKIHMYAGSGYVKDLFPTRKRSAAAISYLERNLWLMRSSRAVFVDFAVYNANINLFCIITLLVEFPATGGAFPSYSFHTVKLIRYVSRFDYFILACEIFLALFIIFYTVEELIEIALTGLKYFTDFWNILDLTLIFVAITCLMFNVLRQGTVNEKLADLRDQPEKYADFQYLGFWETRFNNLVAIMVFIAWVKVFKYISFNKTMTQLSTTLSRCATDLLGFFIMFFIVFLAFTQLGYLLFGTQVEDFSTFMNSFFTLFRIVLGDFDFHQLEQANRILGPIFFMLFVFFVFFVLINMFLAIINDTYSEVKSDMAKQTDLFIMSDYVKQKYNKMWDNVKSTKDKLEGYEKVLHADGTTDGKVDFDTWRTKLLENGYTDEEIETVFHQFDLDNDRYLDAAEQKKMLEELEKQKQYVGGHRREHDGGSDDSDSDDDGEKGEGTVRVDDFTALARRVDRMEGVLAGLVNNIDTVLAQLADKGN